MKKVLSFLVVLMLLTAFIPTATLAASPTFTLMVYMCGTDLESDGGCATADLKEMVKSGVKSGGNVTVYVQTGGTKQWATKGMTNREGERWLVSKDGLERVDSLGRIDMGSGDEFTQFLEYGLKNYPADRYGLVLWDHGAGATDGVCYDEISGNSLNMAKIYQSLQAASKEANFSKFSFVGFDACLMANYEMALHLRPFADYMVASEETEPGEGWDYTQWLTLLAKDPAADIETVTKKIVDSFIQSVDTSYGDFGTLSVLNLSKLDGLTAAMEDMGEALTGEISGGNFSSISRLRQNVRAFGETDSDSSDMIDLSVFAKIFERYDETGAQALTAAMQDAVVYSRNTANLSNVTGLSVLVPNKTRSSASQYLQNYDTENLMPKYTVFVRSLVDQMVAGSHTFTSGGVTQQSVQDATVDWFSQYASDTQTYYDTYNNLWGDSTGASSAGSASGSTGASSDGSDFSLSNFLNTLFGSGDETLNTDASATNGLWDTTADTADSSVSSANFGSLWGDQTTDSAADSSVDVSSGDQTYTLENPFANATGDSAYTLTLNSDDLQNLAYAEAYLMMDVSDPDFECYVDLGYTQDVITDWNQGKLYGLFDGTWPTLAGQMVCIYDQVANENYVRSLIPVTLNGEDTYLLVVFDQEHPGGVVVGSSEGYTDAGQPVRGFDPLSEGDVIVPQYELMYWDANDEQQSEPFEGDPITVGADGTVEFGYEAVETGAKYEYGLCLNDIYGGYQFTDAVTLTY
ncbi:MAG TPA: clostripain-related cysteine peptidase [Candidatus Limiplasma sp.]|nr:clostripain-related cysteine peptidase [Candidatus Limiplasma sp.]